MRSSSIYIYKLFLLSISNLQATVEKFSYLHKSPTLVQNIALGLHVYMRHGKFNSCDLQQAVQYTKSTEYLSI